MLLAILTFPVPASAQTEHWSATLTVGQSAGSSKGYCTLASGRCTNLTAYGTLSDDDFILDGTTYTVVSIRWDTANIHLTLDNDFPAGSLANLTLKVGLDSFALSTATRGNNSNYRWPIPLAIVDPITDLVAGDTVTASLVTTTAPGAPTGLTATATGQSQIDLAWTAPGDIGSSAITGYRIEFSPDGIGWADLVANTQSTATTYAHTGLNAAVTRHYRVSAINDAGTSDHSGSDDATTETAAAGTTFISNSAQEATRASSATRATAFTTGGNSGGYELSSVDIYTADLSGTVTPVVEIYEDDEGIPGELHATLINPATVTDDSVNTFNAQPNTTLNASTIYWLVSSNSATTNGQGFRVRLLTHATANPGAPMGWSIGNAVWKSVITDSWSGTGNRIKFTVKGTAAGTITITNYAPTGAPTITGTARVGQTLTAVTTGILDADGLTSPRYTYQWIRVDGAEADIASANSSTYALDAADLGKTIKVKVSFTDDNGNAETLTSAATATVAADTTPPEVVSSTVAMPGRTMSILFDEILDAGAANVPVSAFSVTADGQAVTIVGPLLHTGDGVALSLSSATTIVQGQAVIVSYTDPTAGNDAVALQDLAGNDVASFTTGMSGVPAVLNSSTATVNTPATGAPTITGTARVGRTLTAATTGITDANGLTSATYTYQWIRVDGSEADIAGANSSTYILDAADLGKTIKVKVSFTDDDDHAETLTSGAYPTSGTVRANNTLVSNVGQSSSGSGDLAASDIAQSFTTGAGATLASIELNLSSFASTVTPTAKLYSGSANGTEVTTLTGPAMLDTATRKNYTFTPSSPVTLLGSTTYWVAAEGAGTWTLTSSFSEDGTPATGWSIANGYEFRTAGSASNFVSFSGSFQIRVNGTTVATTTSSDATLSALALAVASDDSAITISPVFASGTTSYTASVDNGVDVITITPAVNESNATVEYLDSSDTAITDADSGKAGRQVSLTEGANTIKVKVTAQDATTTETYTVVVTRATGTNTAPTAANKTVTTAEDTAYAFTATDFGFVDADSDPLVSVKIVTLPTTGTLALGSTAVLADAVVTKADIDDGDLTFTPVAGESGTGYASFDFKVNDGTDDSVDAYTMTIDVTVVTNHAATGAPAITGTARVGRTLTAATTGILDANGLTSATYTYQWIRVNGADADIAGANSSTYTLDAADLGKTIKVKVSFTDDDGYDETLTSDAYPPSGTVRADNTLVSNVGQSPSGSGSLANNDIAQSFMTGAGATLASIELNLNSFASTVTPTVKLYSGSATGTEVDHVYRPGNVGCSHVKKSIRSRRLHPSLFLGQPPTGSWPRARRIGQLTGSSSEDGTPATGWSIANGYEFRPASSDQCFRASFCIYLSDPRQRHYWWWHRHQRRAGVQFLDRGPRPRGEHRRGPGRRRRGDGHRRRRRRHPRLHAGRHRHGLLRHRRDHRADPHHTRRQLRPRGQVFLHGHGHGLGRHRQRRRRCHHQHHRRGRAARRAVDDLGHGGDRQHHQPDGLLDRPGQ